jgi:hypothetical protein
LLFKNDIFLHSSEELFFPSISFVGNANDKKKILCEEEGGKYMGNMNEYFIKKRMEKGSEVEGA